MTTPKDIDNELTDDLEATDEEAENVKGGGAKGAKGAKGLKGAKGAKFFRGR